MADFSSVLGGAGTGALFGGQFGGPVGAGIGGLLGGIGGLFGGKKKPKKKSTLDPRQQQLYGDYYNALSTGGGPLGDVYGQFNPDQLRDLYNQIYAQPAYQQFQDEVIPSITGQFRGQNLQNSSYLGGALAKAGTNVQNNLNSQLANILYNAQQGSQNRRAQGVQGLLGMNTFDYVKPQASPFDNLLGGLSQGAGQFFAKQFGG